MALLTVTVETGNRRARGINFEGPVDNASTVTDLGLPRMDTRVIHFTQQWRILGTRLTITALDENYAFIEGLSLGRVFDQKFDVEKFVEVKSASLFR